MELRGEETFQESYTWADLAKERGIRLPLWRLPCTTSGMRKYLGKLGIPVIDYLTDNNERTLKQFGQMNPDWPLRAWVGIQLENLNWEPFVEEPIVKRGPGRPKKVVEDA